MGKNGNSNNNPQRPYKQLKTNRIYQKYGKKIGHIDRFFDINTIMSQINGIVGDLMTPNEEDKYPVLDKKAKDELNSLYSALISKCDEIDAKYYADAFKGKDADKKTILQAIKKNALQDVSALLGVNSGLGKTLPEALENSSSKRIDITGKKLKRVGNIKSSRIAMQLVSENGKIVKGVFTPETKVEKPSYLKAMLANMLKNSGKNENESERTQEEKEAAENLINKVLGNVDSNYEYIVQLFSDLNNMDFPMLDDVPKYGNPFYEELQVLFAINPNVFKETVCKIGAEAFMGEISFEENINGSKIYEGQNVDDRNVSMSRVASLLDLNFLLANAQPMSIKNGNDYTHGTFMEFAEGEDLTKVGTDSPFFKCDIQNNIKPSAMKSLADMQILDYICGNLDRHRDNIFYQFDENNNLIGIKGIDNDCSFGVFNKPNETNMINLVNAEYLKAISSKTANIIRNMSDETLLFCLNKSKLNKEEKQCAVNRFRQIKNLLYFPSPEKTAAAQSFSDLNVPEGRIAVIPDELWDKIKVDDLAAKPVLNDGIPRANYFSALKETFSQLHKEEVYKQAQKQDDSDKKSQLEEFELVDDLSVDNANNQYNEIDEESFESLNNVNDNALTEDTSEKSDEQLAYGMTELNNALDGIEQAYRDSSTLKNVEKALSKVKENGSKKFGGNSLSSILSSLKEGFDLSDNGIQKLNDTYNALEKIVDELNDPKYGRKYDIDALAGNLTKCMSALEIIQDSSQKQQEAEQGKKIDIADKILSDQSEQINKDNHPEENKSLKVRFSNMAKNYVTFLQRAEHEDRQTIKEELASLAICSSQLSMLKQGKVSIKPEDLDEYAKKLAANDSFDQVMKNHNVIKAFLKLDSPDISKEELAADLGKAVLLGIKDVRSKNNPENKANNIPKEQKKEYEDIQMVWK